MTGYHCYSIYNGINLHFSKESYNYFQFRGKGSEETYLHHKSRFKFESLARKYEDKSLLELHFACNYLRLRRAWVGDFQKPEADKHTRATKGRIDALKYTVEKETRAYEFDIVTSEEIDGIKTKMPAMYLAYQRGILSPETMTWYQYTDGIISHWVADEMIGASALLKYCPFVLQFVV